MKAPVASVGGGLASADKQQSASSSIQVLKEKGRCLVASNRVWGRGGTASRWSPRLLLKSSGKGGWPATEAPRFTKFCHPCYLELLAVKAETKQSRPVVLGRWQLAKPSPTASCTLSPYAVQRALPKKKSVTSALHQTKTASPARLPARSRREGGQAELSNFQLNAARKPKLLQ